MKRFLLAFLFLCLASSLFAANPNSKIYVTTNAFGSYDFACKHFYVIPGSPEIDPKDAEYKDYAQHVASMMRCKGAIEVTDPTIAELCVLLDYCVTDHTYIERIPVPIRMQVGSVTHAHVYTDQRQGSQSYDGRVDTKSIKSTTHSGNSYSSGSYDAMVANRKIYETVGYKTEEHEINGFRRILNVYVYDNIDDDGDPDMLWKCNMRSDGSRNSLSSIVPVMTYLNIMSPGKRITEKQSWVNIDYGWDSYEAYANVMKNYAYAYFPMQRLEQDTNTWAYFVTKKNGRLVLYVCQGGPGKRTVTMDACLVADGVSYPVTTINHIKPGRKVRIDKDDYLIFTMIFENIPDEVETFDVICPDKFSWTGIVLK